VEVVPALFFLDLAGAGRGLVVVDAMEDDLGAVVPGGLDLRDGGVFGHHHDRVDAEPGGRQRHALGVVAGACRDDPSLAVGLGEGCDPVGRAADLERAGALEGLQFQVDLRPGHLGEGV
jgi:hypothetical protein